MARFLIADWPHGLRCIECARPFAEGEEYVERLEGFAGEDLVTEVVCERCSAGKERDDD